MKKRILWRALPYMAFIGLLAGCSGPQEAARESAPQQKSAQEQGSAATEPQNTDAEPASGAEEQPAIELPNDFISIGGNQIGQTTYTWAAGIADLIMEKTTTQAAAEETKGVGDNISMLVSGDIEFAFMTSQNVLDANHAQNAYKDIEPGKIVSVLGIAPCETHIIVPADSDIASIHDLKGRRIGVGQPGSNVIYLAYDLLDYLGLKKEDYTSYEVNLQTQCDMMRDGQLDVLFWNGTASLPAIAELCLSADVRFLSIDDADLTALCSKYPYVEATIGAGRYNGQTEEVKTYQTRNTLAASIDVPEDTVYQVTKMIFENAEELAKVHAGFSGISAESVLLGQPVDCVHPGALRYYREIQVPGVSDYK